MNYNKEYIDIEVALINALMIDPQPEMLDVSFSFCNKMISIQIVYLEDTTVDPSTKWRVWDSLRGFEIELNTLFISKMAFNKNNGNTESWEPWEPGYDWLAHPLFSKAEQL